MRRKAAAPQPASSANGPVDLKKPTKARGKGKSGGSPSESDGGFLAVMRKSLVDKLGQGAVTSTEDIRSLLGLSLEGKLPLQFLLGMSALPLSKMLSLIGSWGTYKTTNGWSIFGRLFLTSGGYVVYVSTEHKTNWETIDAQFRDIPDYLDSCSVLKANSTEELLVSMYEPCKVYAAENAKEPMLVFVDSLGGVTSEASKESMDKSGLATDVAGHDQQRRARTVTEQMRGVTGVVDENNIFLLVINHEKEKSNSTLPSFVKEKTWVGGDHQNFAYSWIISIRKIGTKKLATEDVVTLKLITTKSTYSPEKQSVEFNVHFRRNLNDAKLEAWIDWDTCLTKLVMSDSVSAVNRKFIGIQASSKAVGSFTFPKITGDELFTAEEAGNLMHNTPELVDRIQRVFGVMRIKEYRNGTIVQPEPYLSLESVPDSGEGCPGEEPEETVPEA